MRLFWRLSIWDHSSSVTLIPLEDNSFEVSLSLSPGISTLSKPSPGGQLLISGSTFFLDIHFDNFDQKIADQMYSNMNAYEALLSLEAAKLITFKLIFKRIDANNKIPVRRKFIAIVKHY